MTKWYSGSIEFIGPFFFLDMILLDIDLARSNEGWVI